MQQIVQLSTYRTAQKFGWNGTKRDDEIEGKGRRRILVHNYSLTAENRRKSNANHADVTGSVMT